MKLEKYVTEQGVNYFGLVVSFLIIALIFTPISAKIVLAIAIPLNLTAFGLKWRLNSGKVD